MRFSVPLPNSRPERLSAAWYNSPAAKIGRHFSTPSSSPRYKALSGSQRA